MSTNQPPGALDLTLPVRVWQEYGARLVDLTYDGTKVLRREMARLVAHAQGARLRLTLASPNGEIRECLEGTLWFDPKYGLSGEGEETFTVMLREIALSSGEEAVRVTVAIVA